MVRIWRFERQAYALGERRSIQLSYIRIYQYFTTKGRLLLRNLASCLGGDCILQLCYEDISYLILSLFGHSLITLRRRMLYPAELPKYIKDNTTSFCLLLRKPMLYPLSYGGIFFIQFLQF